MHQDKGKTVFGALAVAALLGIAACSGDDDSADVTSNAGSASSSSGSSGPATSSAASSGSTSDQTTGEPSSPGVLTAEDPPNPVKGGTLVYGLEADSANPWTPYNTSCATSCYVPLDAVSDYLFATTDEGETVPLLVETVEHNADYTQWTMRIRDGIKFHDGTSLDGASVKFNLDAVRASPLSGAALASIDHVEATGMDVTVFTRGPWVALPQYLGDSVLGLMFSQQWLSSLENVPQRTEGSPVYDATLAATPATGDQSKPVGLGAFKFESYSPGNGNSFKAVRNPDYWRGPNGITGEDLPYLDAVEAVVAVDEDSRFNSTRSGEFDIMMTSMGDTIKQAIDDGSLEINSSDRYGETQYLMLNVAAGATLDPEGKNASSPLLNLDCRKALAHAIDRDRWAQERGGGLQRAANGPFPPGSVGYLEDNGYPEFDIEKAKASMDTCLAALNTDHIDFSFNTTNDPFNVESNSLIVSMWKDAFGDKVTTQITPIEQGQYIGLALTGTFQAFGWRNHGGLDPDQQRLWWASTSAVPIGSLALNFGRFQDPEMDAQLDIIKSNPDPAARKAAAEEVNRIFGAKVYNWWQAWAVWGIISQPYVHGVQANVLPDGTKGIGLAFAGRHKLNQIWCDDGKCE